MRYLYLLNFAIFCLCLHVLLYLWLVRRSSYHHRNVHKLHLHHNILKNKSAVVKFGMKIIIKPYLKTIMFKFVSQQRIISIFESILLVDNNDILMYQIPAVKRKDKQIIYKGKSFLGNDFT